MINLLNSLYRRILFLRREMISYYCYLFKKTPDSQIRVVIFAQGRTGSTLLEDLICSSGHFERNGELLNVNKGEILYPLPFIFGLSRRKPNENFIFHVKIYQLMRDRRNPVDPADFLNNLYKEGWKIIYLNRRNKVKHAVSNFVAAQRASFHKTDDKDEKAEVYIEPESFVHVVSDSFEFEKAEREILKNLDYLEIIYEDDLRNYENHQKTVHKVLNYLGLEKRKVKTRYKKVNKSPINELIVNYDEIKKCVKEQGWEKYL